MVGVRNLPKKEREFYEDKKENIKYNGNCYECARSCKQSWRSQILHCNKIGVKNKKGYLKEIENQNKTIQEVAKAINIHSRTLESLLTNKDRDIDYETHKKLMKYLYNVKI